MPIVDDLGLPIERVEIRGPAVDALANRKDGFPPDGIGLEALWILRSNAQAEAHDKADVEFFAELKRRKSLPEVYCPECLFEICECV